MDAEKVNVAVLGAGAMGRAHAEGLAADERVRLSAVIDPDAARRDGLATEVGATGYESLEHFISDGAADAIYITTPNTTHFENAKAALDAGLNVFCEKPLGTSVQEASALADKVAETGAILQVGFNRRFAPVYTFARRAMDRGFTPYTASAKIWRGELQDPPWVADTGITGGYLYEVTIHTFDLLRWLFGEVTEVICRADQNLYDELDDFAIVLTFESGRHATVSSSAHGSWGRPFERLELCGDHAQIVTDEVDTVSYTSGLGAETETHDYTVFPRNEKWGYIEGDRQFVSTLLANDPSPVSAQDGRRAVEICDAAYRSAQAGGQAIILSQAQ